MLINKFLLFQYSKAIFSLPTRAAILALSQVIDLLIFFVDRSTTSDKIDSNEIALAPESTISPGADSETNYTDSVDLQITLPKKGSFNSVGIPPSVSVSNYYFSSLSASHFCPRVFYHRKTFLTYVELLSGGNDMLFAVAKISRKACIQKTGQTPKKTLFSLLEPVRCSINADRIQPRSLGKDFCVDEKVGTLQVVLHQVPTWEWQKDRMWGF